MRTLSWKRLNMIYLKNDRQNKFHQIKPIILFMGYNK